MPILDVKDFFNGGSGDLAGRNPDTIGTGYAWANSGGEGGAGPATEMGSHIQIASGVSALYSVGNPRSTSYRVVVNGRVNSTGGAAFFGPAAHILDGNNYYRCSIGPNTFRLWKTVGGVVTPLAELEHGMLGTSFDALVELDVFWTGSTNRLRGYLNGVLRHEVFDASLPNKGKGGVRMSVSSGSDLPYVYDFEVIENYINPVRSVT